MANREPLTRNQRIAIGALIVPIVLTVTGWLVKSQSHSAPPHITVTKNGGNAGTGDANIIGNNNTVIQSLPPVPPQINPDWSGIQQELEEIKKNTSASHPTISAVQIAAIKELDQFIGGRDEVALRELFGLPRMMENNIRLNIVVVSHFKNRTPLDWSPFVLSSQSILKVGHTYQLGGGLAKLPKDGTYVDELNLAPEYSQGKAQLLKFEDSTELPGTMVSGVKDLDDAVVKNANDLLDVLDVAIHKNPDYYLRYDDPNSPAYFHKIDGIWLANFIDLKPKADKIRNAIRQYLGVK